MNIKEVFYILSRKRRFEKADYFFDTLLKGLSSQGLPVDLALILAAERLKAKDTLSYADCFAATQALRSEASILTGHPERKAVKNLVTIEWFA